MVELNSISDLRDGEPLELAISEAEKKSLSFRKQANEALALADKWEGVATQLRAARELSRLPAGPPRKLQSVETTRKPHGFWIEKIKQVIGEYYGQYKLGPSKRMVIQIIAKEYPEKAAGSLYILLNKAIDDGRLRFRGPDCLYLPEHDPVQKSCGATA